MADKILVQGSVLSSPGSSVLPSVASRAGLNSPTPSFRPFDRRFSSRIASPSILSPRPSSPAFLGGHSRTTSLSSQLLQDGGDTDTPSPPWEVVRWTRLRKLNGQAFSEAGRRSFGSPTCIAVSATIVLGTTKGIILVFDYNQNLKMIIGPGTKGGLIAISALNLLLTASSRRVRPNNRDCYFCGPHDPCRRPCQWQHLHLGYWQSLAALLDNPSPGSRSARQQDSRWSSARCRYNTYGISGNEAHRSGLRR